MRTTTERQVGERQVGDLADFFGGFIAGEGYLRAGVTSFDCTVALGGRDAAMCHELHAFLGVGHVRRYPRRRDGYDDEVVWTVRSLRQLVQVVVPFLDEHLPASHKREQYLAWRTALLAYWDGRARRRRPCTVEGCNEPRRARGLCRRHYYAAHGR